jgi:hypothetical protein
VSERVLVESDLVDMNGQRLRFMHVASFVGKGWQSLGVFGARENGEPVLIGMSGLLDGSWRIERRRSS